MLGGEFTVGMYWTFSAESNSLFNTPSQLLLPVIAIYLIFFKTLHSNTRAFLGQTKNVCFRKQKPAPIMAMQKEKHLDQNFVVHFSIPMLSLVLGLY